MTIKELREKYNLTQSALARSLGVSSNAISGIEVGRIKLSPKMSARIKEVYGEEVAAAAPVQKAAKKAEEAVASIEAPVEKKAPAKKAATKKAAVEEAAAPVDAPVEKKAPAKKTAEKPIVVEAAAAAPVETPVEEKAAKKAAKKAAPKKKAAAEKPAEAVTAEAAAPVEAPVETQVEKKAPAKKAATKKSAPKKAAAATPTIILQSEFGGEVTAEQILSKVGDVDKVYVRIDQNKLYWVKGDEAGDKDIW